MEERFEASYGAKDWAKNHGFLCGSRQRGAPMGLMREMKASGVSKWRGLSRRERAELDGVIVFPEGSDGRVEVWTRKPS